MAVSDTYQGKGIGSQLFDFRIEALKNLGAKLITGRTILTSPAQYYGNYIKRGLKPIARDFFYPDKTIFAAKIEQSTPRIQR